MSRAIDAGGRPPTLVFGGTFDPPHVTHAAIASRAADLLGARRILVIPAAINPQRTEAPPALAAHRYAMTQLAFRHEPRAKVLDLEIRRGDRSYTVDTLRELAAGGEGPLRLLIGSDQALNFPTWREWRTVVSLAEPAIVLRPPHDRPTFEAEARRVFGDAAGEWIARVLPIAPVDMSGTALRRALADEAAPNGLDPAVAAYAREHLLYARG